MAERQDVETLVPEVQLRINGQECPLAVRADLVAVSVLEDVNAAGMCHWESWGDVTPGNFDLIVAVNCRGLLFLTQAVAQRMVGGGKRGSIINVASIAARRGDPTNVVYSMSKAAVVSLTQSAASAYGAHGIRVNAIAPGFTQTPLLDKLFAHEGARLKQDRAQQENSAMLRIFPVTIVPTGYFSAISIHGSGCACLIPSDTRRSLGLMSSTTTSTSSPTFASFEGCVGFLFQLISET